MIQIPVAAAAAVFFAAMNPFPALAVQEAVGSAPISEQAEESGEIVSALIAETEEAGLVPVLEVDVPDPQGTEQMTTSQGKVKQSDAPISGDPLIVTEKSNGGAEGIVSAFRDFSTDWDQVSALRREVVEYAKRFEGTPYVFGGTSPESGFDCSGFICYVMKQAADLRLARQSAAQATAGRAVLAGEMRPGDIIAYDGTPKNGVVNHVSIYIGDGKAIHAAGRGKGVQITPWDYAAPMAIRNILGD